MLEGCNEKFRILTTTFFYTIGVVCQVQVKQKHTTASAFFFHWLEILTNENKLVILFFVFLRSFYR
jgi:hypothetical protein